LLNAGLAMAVVVSLNTCRKRCLVQPLTYR
jgi:hypothetical protein